MNEKSVFYICGIALYAILLVLLGIVIQQNQWWPAPAITYMQQMHLSWRQTGGFHDIYSIFPAPPGAARETIVVNPDLVQPGFWAITAYNTDTKYNWLYVFDHTGTLVDTRSGESSDTHVPHQHDMLMMPDGSVVGTLMYRRGIARVDRCKTVVWAREGSFHHSVALDDGDLWTWRGEDVNNGHYQTIEKLDAETGETRETIRLIEDVLKPSSRNMTVFSLNTGFQFQRFEEEPPDHLDIFHPNDVEPLPDGMAAAFPMFKPGDLLMSFRSLHLVAVLDRETRQIKWARNGPWRYQHDPDWQSDGTITIFDNNRNHQFSSIVSIHPGTGAIKRVAGETGTLFYTDAMGQHQRLPNGNYLVVASKEGRVLELTPSGEIAMEFNAIVNETTNSLVASAQWYPADYFKDGLTCKAQVDKTPDGL